MNNIIRIMQKLTQTEMSEPEKPSVLLASRSKSLSVKL